MASKRRPPLVRFGARLDQIGARSAALVRTLNRWIAASDKQSKESKRLSALRREVVSLVIYRGRAAAVLLHLERSGYEPSARGHSTLVLAAGMLVAIRRERMAFYSSVWPGERLDRLVVEKIIGTRPVLKGRRGRLGVIPKAHLVTAAS